ncbi:MAG: hypothetical protein HYU36_07140 [Planctomycetes bacterium]|nr:hypothetical protein [Planctomycetota bacterium]
METTRMRLTEEEARSTRRLNLERKNLKCLGCGRWIVTDRCHRFCRVCQRRNRRNQFHLPKLGRLGMPLNDLGALAAL